MTDKPKCATCNDKGYYVPDEAWNFTLQERAKCPDCDIEATDRPKSIVGLVT